MFFLKTKIRQVKRFLKFEMDVSDTEMRASLALIVVLISIYVIRGYMMIHQDKEILAMLNSLPALDSVVHPQVTSFRAFDPNTVELAELIHWGMPDHVARNWLNYRSKAGGFSRIGQIAKLYGMSDSLFAAWQDSLLMPRNEKAALQGFSLQRTCPPEMDLNMADTTMLRRLHGIGKVLSSRIVTYRQLLGGFIAVDQLHDVYGLSDSTYRHISPQLYVDDLFEPTRINLAMATYQELYFHPYISSRQATAIIRFREQHPGSFDLKHILILDSLSRMKISPYAFYKLF